MKFLFAIVLLVLVAAVMCDTDLLTADQKLTTLSPAEIEAQQWTAFKTLHKKVYDDAEDAKRFEIYQKTGAEIVEHNKRFAAGLETYTQGFNELSDLTPEETKNLGGYGPIQ